MDYSNSIDDQVYPSSPHTSQPFFAETHGAKADRTPHSGHPHAVLSLRSFDGLTRNIHLLRGQPVLIARQVEQSTHIPNYIPCESMSRKHAEVWEDREKVYIKDLGSTNGTFVNGKRLSQSASVSQAYELQINDIVEFGTNLRIDSDEKQSFVARVTFAFSASSVEQMPPSETRPVTYEVMAQITPWIGTKQDNEDVPILCWLTHPNDQERSALTHEIADYCAKSNILYSTMFLSRQAVEGWELATLFATQLCQSIPGLQLIDTQLAPDANVPFEDVDEEWIRTFFIEPLITHSPPPTLIIIDSLDASQHSFIKPLLVLAALLRQAPQLQLKLMLTTHPDIRATANIPQDLRDAHIVTEIHVLDTLDRLSRLMLHPPNVRRNTLASVHQIIEYNNLFTCLSTALPDSPNAWRYASTPLEILLQTTRFERLLGQLIEDLKLIRNPEFNEILTKDTLADQATRVKILRDVVLSAEADRSTIRLLQGGDAQLLVDFCQELLDRGTLMAYHGHDFDRKTRRLVVKVATAADILPESVFIKSGIELLEREPYSGGGFSDIFRASYNGEKMALKRLRVYRNNHDRARINRKFCREALTWRPLDHPNVLPFVGVDAKSFPGYLCMISPWMEHGTLPDLRKRYGPQNIQIERRIFEVADGLEYLHFEKIIHGDLRGANILIDEHRHVRLADFGLTVFSDASIATHSEHGGCVRWMAPELFEPEGEGIELDAAMGPRKTEKTDVYAFACVYFEIYKGLAPFSEFNLDPPVIVRVSQGKRPDRPTDNGESVRIPSLVWMWVQQCWHQDPQKRPSMEVVKIEMQRWYSY